jgi:acyl carrier protein
MTTRLRQIIADILGVSPSEIQPTSSPGDFPQWDSAAHIEIILSLEAEFAIAFTPEEMGEVLSLSALEAALRAKGVPAE